MVGPLLLLLLAVVLEVAATSSLPRTEGFRDPLWTLAVLAGYAVSVWMLAIVVRSIPVSVTYALWSGIGTAAVAVIGVVYLGEHLDMLKATAIALIVIGVVILNLHQPAG